MTNLPDQSLLPAFSRGLGVRLEQTRPDLVVGVLDAGPGHGNRNGVMHGGAILAFADTLGGVAAALNLRQGEATTTLESKANFLRAIPLGSRITGRCEPLHRGRKTTVWQTTVFRQDGKPAAIVTQTQLTLIWRPGEG
ncbi:MAG: PaaI family thioesterase [Rhodobacteraceae bacterium]|nr:PaaI family thioesterase [Paracoccaceae bacterium]